MAAQEQQGKRVIRVDWPRLINQFRQRVAHLALPLIGQLQDRVVCLAPAAGALAPPFVDQPARGDRQQPRSRVGRNTFGGPLQRRGEERLLDGILARAELTVPPRERAEDLRRELTQHILDARLNRRTYEGASPIWRISMGGAPAGPMKATTFDASSIARASLSTSTIQ